MTNVQSIVTPATNGAIHAKTNGKAKAKANGSTSLTPAQAIDIAFEYGQTMAGQDGALTSAFATFKANDKVIADMVQALTEGYFVRKLSYDRDEAKRVIGLKKYNQLNPAKNTDDNRTAEQERVMTAVRVLVSRAKRMAGITEAKADTAVKAEQVKAEKEAHEQRLIKADEIINPPDDVDAFDALNRMVLSMKAIQKKYAAKLVGDRGSEWRDWLANAPR
jgi:spore germination protein YaaH